MAVPLGTEVVGLLGASGTYPVLIDTALVDDIEP